MVPLPVGTDSVLAGFRKATQATESQIEFQFRNRTCFHKFRYPSGFRCFFAIPRVSPGSPVAHGPENAPSAFRKRPRASALLCVDTLNWGGLVNGFRCSPPHLSSDAPDRQHPVARLSNILAQSRDLDGTHRRLPTEGRNHPCLVFHRLPALRGIHEAIPGEAP